MNFLAFWNRLKNFLVKDSNSKMEKLNIGDIAPDFSSVNQDGKEINLHDYKGKKVVLYFYPKDDTPGCTAQACNLRDNMDMLKSKGYTVLGVSPDTEKSHKKFADKFDLNFDLVADGDKKIVNDYGVYGEKNMYGKKVMGIFRTTFLLDEEGKISDIISKVDTKEHTSQIIK